MVVTFNGDRLLPRKPMHTFEASLETLVADEEGVMRSTGSQDQGETSTRLFPAKCRAFTRWGCRLSRPATSGTSDVGQKVPLNRDRNNVKPAFLRAVRTLVLNEMNERLTDDDANDDWVRQASSDPACSDQAIRRVLDLRFGEKRAAYDPTDPEANKTWVSKGGTRGLRFDDERQEWKKAKEAGAIQPAGRLCPTPKPYSDDPNAPPVKVIPKANGPRA